MTSLTTALSQLTHSKNILSRDKVGARSNGFWNPSAMEAKALVMPETSEELRQTVELCNNIRQTIVVQGGLTGAVEGQYPTNNDLVVSTEKMNRILSINVQEKTMLVEAGCTLEQVQQAAAEKGLLFALDIGARGSCTIGGNIATNAGGMEVIRYGMMRDQVLGLEAVMADGTLLSSLNSLQKNNAGYDLKHLLIGTEGTLGVVTKAVLKLRPLPRHRQTALLGCESFHQVDAILANAQAQLGESLNRFELLSRAYYEAQTSFGGHDQPMPSNLNWYVLLEYFGNQEDALEKCLTEIHSSGMASDIVVAGNQKQEKALWSIRDSFEGITSRKLFFNYDISLPISTMESYLKHLESAITSEWPRAEFYSFGHMGDGNLHLFVMPGIDDKKLKDKANRMVYQPLGDIGGSVSAEHGIGLEKKPWLGICRNKTEIEVMAKLKALFDPNQILNPGRIFDIRPR